MGNKELGPEGPQLPGKAIMGPMGSEGKSPTHVLCDMTEQRNLGYRTYAYEYMYIYIMYIYAQYKYMNKSAGPSLEGATRLRRVVQFT